jgi:antitoxin component YwqK of YwqJK toxin-antitoxin module
MKKTVLFFLLYSILGFSQTDFNKLDDKGLKHGLWKGFYPESKRLRYQGTFSHGKETGTFYFYDDTKAADIIGVRVFNENDNSVYTTFYDQKKNIVSEGKSINKLNEGIWKYYHFESKEIMTIENYVNGKLDGTRKVFFKNGKIAEECNYKNGLKDGIYNKYLENGTIIETAIYKNNEYNGLAVYRDIDNNIVSKGLYTNGKKTGIWQFWDIKTKKFVNKNMDLQGRKIAKKQNSKK